METKTLEPYQARAVEWLTQQQKAILKIPAGGGKTIVAAAALDALTKTRGITRIGWLAPTIETRNQAINALAEYPRLKRADIRASCIHDAVDMRERQILIVDECKHATAPSWKRIVEQCHVRWGLDATPFGDDSERNAELRALFNNNIYTVEREQVNRLVDAKVILLDAFDPGLGERITKEIEKQIDRYSKFSSESRDELFKKVSWQVCRKMGIKENRQRNAAIIETARQHAFNQVLILVNEIEHGEALAKAIPGARLIHSKLPKKQRRETLEAAKNGDCGCLVATSLADEGLDIPCLNVLILASGGRSKIKAEQRTGRVLRAFGGKGHGLIYDFRDSAQPVMASQARKRIAVYKSLGYQIEQEQ
jgi:superfamily II DNA or RNA helicase